MSLSPEIEESATALSEWPPARTRSPWLMYLAVWLSAGYFSFVWLILLIRDINRVERRQVFPTTIVSLVLIGWIAVIALLPFIVPWPPERPQAVPSVRAILSLTVSLSLLAFLLVLFVFVARHLAKALGRKFGVTGGALTVVLTILVYLSLPLMQRRLNILIEQRQELQSAQPS